ncbi:ARS-binding 2 [Hyphodiscus hymeniophilus]|uniref:ARS-binding 2 n=1 Tax=Hyphodiscus hymeniophilus TaxID=353542 RepID=A0A9P7AW43_9HELO|nr:ARS-binding 2 [Hyphodiscus hymeniophilus]
MGVISETTKRRLEREYAPTHPVQDTQGHKCIAALEQMIPQRPIPVPTTESTRQDRRRLPTRVVIDDNLDDAYVDFILYCNPAVASEIDTTELRKIFRAPPRSDGKSFSTFRLFELIGKLERKEIKTWAQLALDLGVEPPSSEKGQSAQKVQQYSVRLKRWMHAMHVDAFFEYLLNKAHVYWTQVPSINEPPSEFGRDGVTAEEDLALRALLPEMRPKRGRRKAEDKEDDLDIGKSPNQRRRLDSPTLSEDFMLARASLNPSNPTPDTIHPGFHAGFGRLDPERMDPWSSTGVRPNAFRWGAESGQTPITATPMTAYPQSAITPNNRNPQLWHDEPRSAVTPNSKTRSRRRHGPAVSSAWTGNGSASSGKLRGRPPTNRSIVDGPFSTFPANPGDKDVPTINVRDNTPTTTPVVSNTEMRQFFPADMNAANSTNTISQVGRPSRLQLQVPERQGGAVRLATPPPIVLVDEEGSTNLQQNAINNQPLPMMEYFTAPGGQDPTYEHFVSIAFQQNEDTDQTNVNALESHFICEILAADWYDVAGNSIGRCTTDEASKICKQVVKNLQTESSSTEAFLINLSALAGGPLMTRLRMTRLDYEARIDYECHWKMRFGSIAGDFTIRTTVQRTPDTATSVPNMAHGNTGVETEEMWKKKYLDLQQQIRERDETVAKLKVGVLDALVGTQKYANGY